MKKYFVTYNQALALKELGFNEPCFKFIYIGDTAINTDHYCEVKLSESKNYNDDLLCISQPLKSHVFEWFRNKYNITSWIVEDKYGFSYQLFSKKVKLSYSQSISDTYEEAESACIDKLIEIIKSK